MTPNRGLFVDQGWGCDLFSRTEKLATSNYSEITLMLIQPLALPHFGGNFDEAGGSFEGHGSRL